MNKICIFSFIICLALIILCELFDAGLHNYTKHLDEKSNKKNPFFPQDDWFQYQKYNNVILYIISGLPYNVFKFNFIIQDNQCNTKENIINPFFKQIFEQNLDGHIGLPLMISKPYRFSPKFANFMTGSNSAIFEIGNNQQTIEDNILFQLQANNKKVVSFLNEQIYTQFPKQHLNQNITLNHTNIFNKNSQFEIEDLVKNNSFDLLMVYDDSLINAYKTSKSDYFSQISILEKNIIKIMSLLDKRSLLMVVSDFGNQEIEYDQNCVSNEDNRAIFFAFSKQNFTTFHQETGQKQYANIPEYILEDQISPTLSSILNVPLSYSNTGSIIQQIYKEQGSELVYLLDILSESYLVLMQSKQFIAKMQNKYNAMDKKEIVLVFQQISDVESKYLSLLRHNVQAQDLQALKDMNRDIAEAQQSIQQLIKSIKPYNSIYMNISLYLSIILIVIYFLLCLIDDYKSLRSSSYSSLGKIILNIGVTYLILTFLVNYWGQFVIKYSQNQLFYLIQSILMIYIAYLGIYCFLINKTLTLFNWMKYILILIGISLILVYKQWSILQNLFINNIINLILYSIFTYIISSRLQKSGVISQVLSAKWFIISFFTLSVSAFLKDIKNLLPYLIILWIVQAFYTTKIIQKLSFDGIQLIAAMYFFSVATYFINCFDLLQYFMFCVLSFHYFKRVNQDQSLHAFAFLGLVLYYFQQIQVGDSLSIFSLSQISQFILVLGIVFPLWSNSNLMTLHNLNIINLLANNNERINNISTNLIKFVFFNSINLIIYLQECTDQTENSIYIIGKQINSLSQISQLMSQNYKYLILIIFVIIIINFAKIQRIKLLSNNNNKFSLQQSNEEDKSIEFTNLENRI